MKHNEIKSPYAFESCITAQNQRSPHKCDEDLIKINEHYLHCNESSYVYDQSKREKNINTSKRYITKEKQKKMTSCKRMIPLILFHYFHYLVILRVKINK